MLKKLKIILGGNVFEFESDGTIPFAEVFKLAGDFLNAVLNADQAKIDALTARAKASNDKLTADVESATS